jgi:hypothetical protein
MLAEGWSYEDGARMMGLEYETFVRHIKDGAARLPGDLPPRLRAIAWYRGASADVLGAEVARPLRQETLKIAYLIREGRACPHCGYMMPHDDRKSESRGNLGPA